MVSKPLVRAKGFYQRGFIMMSYAQVTFQAEQLGCCHEEARTFARKIMTTAALLAMMPEDVLQAWCEYNGENMAVAQPLPINTKTRAIDTLSEVIVS